MENTISICIYLTNSSQDIYRTLKNVSALQGAKMVVDFSEDRYGSEAAECFRAKYYFRARSDPGEALIQLISGSGAAGVMLLEAGDSLPGAGMHMLPGMFRICLRDNGVLAAGKTFHAGGGHGSFRFGRMSGQDGGAVFRQLLFFPNRPEVLGLVFGGAPADENALREHPVRNCPMPVDNYNAPVTASAPGRRDSLIPVLIPGAFGRTGSTLVMQLLATSPQIALVRTYPLEWRYLTYLLHLCRLVNQTVQPGPEWDTTTLAQRPPLDALKPFPCPYPELKSPFSVFPEDADPAALRRDCLKALWKECSRVMKQKRGSAELPVRYYAEKAPSWAYEEISRAMPVMGVFTIRDPRDVFLSHKAWHARPLWGAESQEETDPDTAAYKKDALTFARGFRARFGRVKQAARVPFEYVLKYEDLMADLQGGAAGLAQWLGTELYPQNMDSSSISSHLTSPSARDSVYRWKREMSPEVVKIFTEALGDEMREFGYETRC